MIPFLPKTLASSLLENNTTKLSFMVQIAKIIQNLKIKEREERDK